MKNIFYSLFTGIFVFTSCSLNNDEFKISYDHIPQMKLTSSKPTYIDVDGATKISEEAFFKNKTFNISFTKLDNTVPIGTIEKMRVYKDRFYFLSEDKLYVYNSKSGKFLFMIDAKGHGHNEYILLRDFQVLPKEELIMCIDDMQKKLFFFSMKDGKLVKSINSLIGTPYVRKMGNLYFHDVLFGNDFNDDETWQILVSNGKEFKRKGFRIFPIQKNAMRNNIYETNSGITFAPLFSDTIYHINKKLQYSVSYIFKNKHSIWSMRNEELDFKNSQHAEKKSSYSYLASDTFWESNNGILFQMAVSDKDFRENLMTYYYDKISKENLLIETSWSGPINYVTLPDQLMYNDSNTYYGIFADMHSLKSYINSKFVKHNGFKKLLSDAKSGDNPVIMSFEIK